MAHVIFSKSLCLVLIYVATLNTMSGDKFIGNYFRGKIRKYIESTSNATNHKLWMKYLEKRLEIIFLYDSMHHLSDKRKTFSVLHFHRRILQRGFASKMHILCPDRATRFQKIIQNDIFGSICASSKDGEVAAVIDLCMNIPPFAPLRKWCKLSRGKENMILNISANSQKFDKPLLYINKSNFSSICIYYLSFYLATSEI